MSESLAVRNRRIETDHGHAERRHRHDRLAQGEARDDERNGCDELRNDHVAQTHRATTATTCPDQHGNRAECIGQRAHQTHLPRRHMDCLDDLRQPEACTVEADHEADAGERDDQRAPIEQRCEHARCAVCLVFAEFLVDLFLEPGAFSRLKPLCLNRAIEQYAMPARQIINKRAGPNMQAS